MRHIQLNNLLTDFYAADSGKKAKASLERAHKKLSKKKAHKTRQKYISKNGSNKWTPFKKYFIRKLGKKCWYTEIELIGAPLAVDHFRPVCDYWWLAFDAENYRIACPLANSLGHNTLYSKTGGKADNFPLLPPGTRATQKKEIVNEKPIILDPCVANDCDLLIFQSDGRPVVNPNFKNNTDANKRVDESKLLLNIDHPDLNTKREQLHDEIIALVIDHEKPSRTPSEKSAIRNKLMSKISADAQFSSAARYYLAIRRDLDWVEDMLKGRTTQL